MSPPSLAQIAYEAYCQSRHWLSLSGDHLPQWHDQTPELKSAWNAAAEAVKANLSSPGATPPQDPPGDKPNLSPSS